MDYGHFLRRVIFCHLLGGLSLPLYPHYVMYDMPYSIYHMQETMYE